ncbi:MAG: ABC transporter [Anaerolineaceae bacterium]|nr:ABC transporter [Anaerolineaceae bacterium]
MVSAFSEVRKERFSWRNWSPARRREALWGLGFISPWLIGFLIFYLAPMIASLVFSTMNFELTKPDGATFIGLQNWQRLLNDDTMWLAMSVTFVFAIISLPIGMISAFLLAVLLNSANLMGRSLFRTLYYAPTMVPLIASTLIWAQVLNPSDGWINRFIEIFGFDVRGVDGLRWLNDPAHPNLVFIAYSFIGLWTIGNAMLINLSALQGVPSELYDAARVDGASWLNRLWSITIPMVSPVIFYNLVLSVIGLLQYFIVPWVLTGGSGDPEGRTMFYMIHFFKQGFIFNKLGYGATLAWLMFAVALVITVMLFGSARYWVHYAGDSRS